MDPCNHGMLHMSYKFIVLFRPLYCDPTLLQRVLYFVQVAYIFLQIMLFVNLILVNIHLNLYGNYIAALDCIVPSRIKAPITIRLRDYLSYLEKFKAVQIILCRKI